MQNSIAAAAAGLAKCYPKLEIYATLFLSIAKQRTFGAAQLLGVPEDVVVPNYSPKEPHGWHDIARAGLLPITYLAPDSFNVARDFLVNFDVAHLDQDQLTRMIHNEFRLMIA